jgi:hypothetical protein
VSQSFRDNRNRTWLVEINVSAVRRVRALVGVDLSALLEDKLQPLAALLDDPVKLCDVLFALCQSQAQDRQVTDEDFGAALAGDALEAAADALLEALVNFSPGRKRAALRGVMAKSRRMGERVLERVQKKVTEFDPETVNIDELLANLERPNGSSGSAPESSASTPAP